MAPPPGPMVAGDGRVAGRDPVLARGFTGAILRTGAGGGEGRALMRLQPLFRDLIKSSTVAVENGVGLRVGLPAPDRDIDEGRLIFEAKAAPADLLARHDGRARAEEWVEDDIALGAAIAHGVGDQAPPV